MTSNNWWRKDSLAERLPFLRQRTAMTAALRAFFLAQDFLEVETPGLQISPGLEPHLKAFRTGLEDPFGGPERDLYLHTSPEFAMKKLLAGGLPRIFQLARVWRNGERSDSHHPEFTMLEWYRAGAGYEGLMEDCEGLLRAALAATGQSHFAWKGQTCSPSGPFERLTVQEAFLRHTGIDILALADDTTGFRAAAQAVGCFVSERDSWDDIFFRLFLEQIETRLGMGRPTILMEYPVAMAALSRPKPSDPRVAERFELYVCGLELANAFGELTDAGEQRRRFELDMDLKQSLYGLRYPIDEDFIAALEEGLPPCAGIALGVDRLALLASHAARIEDVLWAWVAFDPREGR